MRAWTIVFISLFLIQTAYPAEPLLRNRGFESRTFAGWETRGKGWTIDEQRFSEGTVSALCTIQKGDKPGLRACVQKVTGVAEGKLVEVSVAISGVSVIQPSNSKACLAVLCFDAQGAVLKEYRASVVHPSAEFQPIKIDDAIVLPGTTEIYIMLVVEVFQPATDGDYWRFDNVALKIN